MSSGQTDFWAVPENEQAELKAAIAKATAAKTAALDELMALKLALMPVMEREGLVQVALEATYARGHGGQLLWTGDGIEERKPLFEQLTLIADRWGELKSKRASLASAVKAYERDIAKMVRILAHDEWRRNRKANAKL